MSNIIERYIAGDKSLLVEIEDNAKSQNSLHKLARRSIAKEAQAIEQAVENHTESGEEGSEDLEASSRKRARLDIAEHTGVVRGFNEQMLFANGLLREHIPMRERMLDIGAREISQLEDKWNKQIGFEQSQLETQRAKSQLELQDLKTKHELTCQGYTAEIEYRRELARIQALEMPKPIAKPDEITVLSTYTKHCKQFAKLTRAQEHTLLCEAGKKAAQEYLMQRRAWPNKVAEGAYSAVNSYPKDFQPAILQVLQDAYRTLKHGAGQQQLSFKGVASIVVNPA